jgi:hypothetical protein
MVRNSQNTSSQTGGVKSGKQAMEVMYKRKFTMAHVDTL